MTNIWIISDNHFNWVNGIYRFKRSDGSPVRNFKSVTDMNEFMVFQHNKVVKPFDHVYFLGDFSMNREGLSYACRLNGHKRLIRGNHDIFKTKEYLEAGFEEIYGSREFPKQKAVLSHYPIHPDSLKHGNDEWKNYHGHCVDEKTEILTFNGWKKYNEISVGDEVYSYNPNKLTIEKDFINEIIILPKYVGEIYEVSGKGINFRVTGEHIIPYYNFSRGKAYFHEESAQSLFSRNSGMKYFIKSGNFDTKGLSLPSRMLELYISIAADGNITPKNLVRMSVKKLRKHLYFKELLDFLKIEYKEFYVDNRLQKYSLHFRLPKELESFNIKGLDRKLIDCDEHDCEEILAAYSQTDGGPNGNQVAIYTSKECEKDLLQQVFTINGFTSTCSSRIHGFGKNLSHTIYVRKLKYYVTGRNFMTNVKKEFCGGEELFWCIKNINQNFFIRRNGKICLTGNCHYNLVLDKFGKPDKRYINVSVECVNYTPQLFLR